MRTLTLLTILLLAGCSTTSAPISYTPPATTMRRGAPVVGDVGATDARGESAADAKWIGTIRGGFGNPIKRLEADRPVAEVVADATRRALQARGLFGPAAAPVRVQIRVEQLEADQVARREAKVRLHFTWRRDGGRAPFENEGAADVITGSLITFEAGVFGSVDALQATAAQALSQAIDRALDDPALIAYLAPGRA